MVSSLERDLLIHKERGERERDKNNGKRLQRSKWYDSWSNLNYGFIFLTFIFFVVALHDVSKRAGMQILSLMFSNSVEKKIIKGKGALWRTIYFYGFLLFSGLIGYINRFSFGKYLNQRTPYRHFTSWRAMFFTMGIFALNGMWIVNAIHYDLTFSKSAIHYMFKMTCIWLELLWTLEVLLSTRNTIFQYILQAPMTAFKPLHKQLGIATYITTLLHFLLSALTSVAKQHPDHLLAYLKDCFLTNPYSHFNRSTAFLIRIFPLILLFILSSLHVIRRRHWEVFSFFHRTVSVMVVCALFHHAKRITLIIRLPVLLYLVDIAMRLFSILTRAASIASCRCVGDIIILDISVRSRFLIRRPFGRLVGAVVYLNIPWISRFQFHPISVAFSRNNHLICYVKMVGSPSSWTRELARVGATGQRIPVNMEGPYCIEHNREVADQGLQAVVSTYDLMDVARPNPEHNYVSDLTSTYGQNLLFVAGGVGFAGISSYLLDVLHKLERSLEHERRSISVTVIVSMAEEEHLMAMRPVLVRCQQASFMRTHYYCTHRSHPEALRSLPPQKDACEVAMEKVGLDCLDNMVDIDDVEGFEMIPIRYTAGRPPLEELLQSVPYQPLSVFCCGPEEMVSSLFSILLEHGRMFSFHNEVYDL